MKPKILVHGGAGEWNVEPKTVEQARGEMKAAVIEGLRIMKKGSSVDAVVAAITLIEDSGKFNAGSGAYPNIEYDIELDAGLMDGRTLGAGAVASVRNVPNPVELARKIMTDTRHVLISGRGAEILAKGYGLYSKLKVDKARKDIINRRMKQYISKEKWIRTLPVKYRLPPVRDTIGAVAIDENGNLAAATSTGGTAFKLPGRIGDSPVCGAGFYAMNGKGAVSATGEGEDIMRYSLSSRVVWDLDGRVDPYMVLIRELQEMKRLFGRGSAGAIVLDSRGNCGAYATTRAMAVAGCSQNAVISEVVESVGIDSVQEKLRRL